MQDHQGRLHVNGSNFSRNMRLINTTPAGPYTCTQHKGWGKCREGWMTQGSFCRRTCGVCGKVVAASLGKSVGVFEGVNFGDADPDPAADHQSDDSSIIKDGQNLKPGTVLPARKETYPPRVCDDVPPPGRLTCAQHKAWLRCEELWMRKNNYCAMTCGRFAEFVE